MDYTLNTAGNVIGQYPYDITINYFEESDIVKQKINEIVNSSDVDDYVKYGVAVVPIKRTVNYTKEFKEYAKNRFMDSYDELFEEDKYDYISFVILDDDSYDAYKKEIGLSEDKVILFNNYKGVTYSNDKRIKYDIPVIDDENVTLSICDVPSSNDGVINEDVDNYCRKNVNNVFITEKSHYLMPELASYDSYKIVVNERIFNTIVKDVDIQIYTVNIVSDNYSSIDKLGEELNKQENVYYTNIKEDTKMERNLILTIKILMYGFIALVTLIGITSVFILFQQVWH